MLGYDALHLLGYHDSGMPDTETNARPDNFANAPLDEAVGRLVRIIRAERPQVIITYREDRNVLPAPRPHPGARDLGPGVRARPATPRRIPTPASRGSRSKLYYVGWSIAPREGAARRRTSRAARRARTRRGSSAASTQTARRLHDAHRRGRLPAQAARGAARAPHAGRPRRASGCGCPTTSSARSSRGRSSCSPARSSTPAARDGEYEDDLFAGHPPSRERADAMHRLKFVVAAGKKEQARCYAHARRRPRRRDRAKGPHRRPPTSRSPSRPPTPTRCTTARSICRSGSCAAR